MSTSRDDAENALSAYVGRLRRRALAQHGGTGLLLALSLFALALLAAAAVSGPVVSPRWARTAWLLCTLPAAGALGYAVLRLRAHRGDAATKLLHRHAPDLARSLRSAIELSRNRSAEHSRSLSAAHVRAVRERVREVPVQSALPWRDLRTPWVGVGFAVCLLALGLASTQAPLQGGLVALMHPAEQQADGMLRAPVVEALSARLVFPSYLRREPEPVANPDAILAPVGTTIELSMRARLPAQEVMLVVGPQRMRLTLKNDMYRGRIVAREDAALEIQLRSDGQWYRDATERRVIAQVDHVPLVELVAPHDGGWVHADQAVELAFRAQDNEGLSEIDLAVRLPDGQEVRRTLWSGVDAPEMPDALQDETAFMPARLGVRPGDRFELWLEASDGDIVTGPNVGRSKVIALEALSHARYLSQHLPSLKRILDLGVVALADRLETHVPDTDVRARARYGRLRKSEAAWLTALDELVDSLSQQNADALGFDDDQLAALAKRVRKKRRREAALHRGGIAPKPAREQADKLLVDELETDVLLLADLLSQAHLDEANALANELKGLKGRIQELLEQLAQSDNEEGRRELLAEIARAERRLKELMRSMAQLATHVPSEFVNQDALGQPSAHESMQDLQSSIQNGDLDAAAKHLEQLEQQLDALAKGLESGGLRFREARFGERDKAMMEARQQLAMLSEEQGRLAQQSVEQTRRIMNRAGRGKPQQGAEGLRDLADDVGRQMSKLGEDGLGLGEQRTREQAEARLRDTRDALKTGDLSEAQRMAAASQRALDQLARNLENDARMFPGHDGRAGQNAQAARAASDTMSELQQRIAEQTPRLADNLTPDDRRQMERLADSQRAARKAADKLRDALSKGPQDLPLSPEGAESVERAQDAMRRAEQQLQRDDSRGAALTQEEAADELRQLSEELARRQSGGIQGGTPRDGRGNEGDVNGRVDIPDPKDFEAPTARRRRLLDAMREGTPPGYESAVGAYYRELLQ